MPNYPFGYDETDLKKLTVDLAEQEEEDRRNDFEEAKNAKQYRDKHKPFWIEGARSFNVVQRGTPDDTISNIYIGLGRMIMDQGIGMMTEGEPDFDYEPLGPMDGKKAILWKSAVKMVLSQCNYKSHQDKFVTDFHVFGPGVFEVYTQLPMRTLRDENDDGSFSSRMVRDFRRSKVGVRHVSPFHCWRNPNVIDPDEVPSCGKEWVLTRNQFINDYANAYVEENGEPKRKYKHVDMVLGMVGTHVKMTRLENEVTDSVRLYALPFGDNPEGEPSYVPEHELGIPIFDKALKIKRKKQADGSYRSSGLNVLGMTTLCFGANNGMYDDNYQTHSLYGMGIPQLIEGPDIATQAFVNMNFDNMRLANTVGLSYKPYDGVSQLDIDSSDFYSGMVMNGDLVATPFGQVRLSENQVMNEWLNQTAIALTGINFQQLVGDTSKTAFEFAQRIRSNNQRAEKRIRSLENGCFKRLATLLLANILSELTVEEWDDLSEEQVKAIGEKIAKNELTAEDYRDLNGKKPQKRFYLHIPIDGRNFREDFTGRNKTRTLDYNGTENTLVEDKSQEVAKSYVPLVKKYVYPADDIESIIHFTVRVDGKRMLGDLRAQDMQTLKTLNDYFANRFTMFAALPDQLPNVDMKKLDDEMLKIAQVEPSRVMKGEKSGSAMLEAANQISTTPPPNAPMAPQQAPQPAPAPVGPAAPSGAALGPPNALAAASGGAL